MVFALLCVIFVRGNPVSFGYPPVTESCVADVHNFAFKQRMSQLRGEISKLVFQIVTFC